MVSRVQDAGLAKITSLLIASAFWLQWGTGSAAVKGANVVTTTTTTEARTSAALTQTLTTVANDTLQLTGTITAAGARSITEVGAFDAVGAASPPTGGNMDFYSDFGVVTLATADSIAFTIKVSFA